MAGDDIVFQFDIAAALDAVRRAIATETGIAGWWTDRAQVDDRPGGRAVLEFPAAERAYDFAVTESAPARVEWATGEHPPEWRGTTIAYEMTPLAGTTRLFFRHGGFRDEPGRAIPAFIWGQLMPRLRRHAETGLVDPFFRVGGAGNGR